MPSRLTHAAHTLLACLALSTPCLAMWRTPTQVPVGRLVTNLTAYTKEHPADAEGFYLLGRVHGLAFVKRLESIATWRDDGKPLPNIARDDWQQGRSRRTRDNPRPDPPNEELAHHMSEAVKAFTHALELDKKPPAHYQLGYAYVLELGASMAEKASTVPGATPLDKLTAEKRTHLEALIAKLASESESTRKEANQALRAELRDAANLLHAHRDDESAAMKEAVHDLLAELWREEAIAHYFQAYSETIDEESKMSEQPMRGLSTLVSYEAGRAYIKLMKARGATTKEDKERLAKAEKDIEDLQNKPPNMAMTPIIFRLDAPAPLSDLLDPRRTVLFDLDGDGTPEPRPWLQPGTALLAWDPDHTGIITSGRQLFGSVTWWFFFSNGYRALDALDDNRDHQLSGPELHGLAVWFDRNANALSDPGEVVPIELTGITAISTLATTTELNCPANPSGLTLASGRTLPTYDWIAGAIPDTPPRDAGLVLASISPLDDFPTPPTNPPTQPDVPIAISSTTKHASRRPR